MDMSPDASAIDYMKQTKLTRVAFSLNIMYTPQSQQSYNCQEYDFKHHNIRDTHFDYSVKKQLEGLNSCVLMYNTDGTSLPWYAKKGTYWFLSLIFLGWF
jgi:hypothetical protein